MKRLFICLFVMSPLLSCSQVLVFGTTPPAVNENCENPTTIGEFIRDDFSGSSLGANWTVTNPGSQTITVSGGRCRVQGGLSTKTFSLALIYSGYGYSMMRNYTLRLYDVHFNSIGANSFGFYVGATAKFNDANMLSAYANLNPSAADDSLEILNVSNLNVAGNSTRTASGLPPINTSNRYDLIYDFFEGTVTATIINNTTVQQASITYTFPSVGATPRVPPVFRYSMGVCGDTDVDFTAFSVSTTQKRGIKYLFIGNSITYGYSSGDFLQTYPYLMERYTTCDVQILAGPGTTADDNFSVAHEIIDMQPQIVFSMIGTNNSPGTGVIPFVYELLSDQLIAAGIDVRYLSIVNGGNPATPGTYNANLSVSFNPAKVVDIYTNGWSVMLANPSTYMFDAIHPKLAGEYFLSDAIKAQLPLLFPQ